MVRVIPLGGLGEFGLNSMVVETPDGLILVDAGLMFGRPEEPSVGIVLPDFRYLEENAHRFKAVLLTHAHEDHVGALPSLLARLPVPVYGTRLTLGFLAERLGDLRKEVELREVSSSERFRLAEGLEAEALNVTHSMPGALGYAFHTPVGAIIHSGDFKLDREPPDGKLTDQERFGELGDQGVALLLSDSTNAEHEGWSGSEADVKRAFDSLLAEIPGRIIITMFASSLHRVQNLLWLAEKHGRRVVLHGRSMHRNTDLASKLDALQVPPGLLVSPEESVSLPPGRVLVLATGSQAEPGAGLWQMAFQDTAALQIERGDTVIMSARAIPGNEAAVEALVKQLEVRGARVLQGKQDPPIHVSGHGARDEQRRLMELTRPRTFVPIHGEPQQLHSHLELARSSLPSSRAVLLRDGDVLELSDVGARVARNIRVERRPFDRFSGAEVTSELLKERTQLAELGIVVATLALDADRRVLVSGPHLHGRGLSEEEQRALEHMVPEVREAFLELSPALWGDEPLVREELTRVVRRAFRLRTQKRPAVLPVVLRL